VGLADWLIFAAIKCNPKEIAMRSTLVFVFSFFLITLYGQGLKGDWMMAGIAQVDHFESSDSKSFQAVHLRSQLGYCIGNGVCIGVISTLKNRSSFLNHFSVQPFCRITMISKRLSPFVQLSGGIGRESYSSRGFTETDKYTYLTLKPGIAWRAGGHVTFDMSLGLYKSYRRTHGFHHSNPENKMMADFGLTYYFSKSASYADSFNIADFYLKKGTKSIGIDGGEHNVGRFYTSYKWSANMKDKLGLSVNWLNVLRRKSGDLWTYNSFSVEANPYFQIRGNAFFVPSVGLYNTTYPETSDTNFGNLFFANFSPSIVYIGRRNIVEIGLEALYLINKKVANERYFSAHTRLGASHFISPKLALKAEVWNNLVGLDFGQDSYLFWEPTGSFHLQFGFRYFYQKQPKN
jgi:hypothetical protein